MVRERKAMIDSQLRVSGVNDPAVLAAFAAVPREDFVPASAAPWPIWTAPCRWAMAPCSPRR
jgi:protein-L-isoaspartate O-methyltransferase